MKIDKLTKKSEIQILSNANSLERFQHIFACYWQTLSYWQNQVITSSDIDDIHNLRIALRRFCLSIKLYEYFTSKKVKKKFKKSLENLASALGKLRNIDEAVLYFKAHTNYSSRHQLYKNLSNMRSVHVKLINSMLCEFNHQFDSRVLKMSTQLESTPFTEESNLSLLTHVSNISTNLSHTIHDHLDIPAEARQRKSRHALRIAIRKWRYYLELFAIILNRDYDALLKILRKYQAILGGINDIASFVKLCKDMSLSPPDAKLIKKSLLVEEKLLLKKLTKLIKEKPL